MSLTGHHMPPRTTQQSHRPRVSDRTMVGTLPPRCLQALPHGTKNAATDGPGYRATPRSTTEPHRGWMSDTYLLHLHAEGEKCFLLTSPFIERRTASAANVSSGPTAGWRWRRAAAPITASRTDNWCAPRNRCSSADSTATTITI